MDNLTFLFEKCQHIYYGPFYKYLLTNRLFTAGCAYLETCRKNPFNANYLLTLRQKMKLLKINGKIKICLFQCTLEGYKNWVKY